MKKFKEKNIYIHKKEFFVIKIRGSKNLDEAKKKRDWLQEHNWQEV